MHSGTESSDWLRHCPETVVVARGEVEFQRHRNRTVLILFSINYFSWPQGKYCIYKKGAGCPRGLQAGFVYWDDENIDNKNHFNGDLPEGEYTDKTKISFCCSTTGKAESEIVLPTEKPFYLFPYGDTTCQKVGMWFSEGFCR